MVDKNYIKYLEKSTQKIRARIMSGKWEFGDHRRLKEQLDELARYASDK